jgi:hypothetical protein
MSIIGIYDKNHMCIMEQMAIKKMEMTLGAPSIARICPGCTIKRNLRILPAGLALTPDFSYTWDKGMRY